VSHLITLRHATPAGNLRSILSTGLDPARAQGKLRAVWLHSPSRSTWAVAHVSDRHQARSVHVLSVRIPRSWLVRRRSGIWSCKRHIPARLVSSVVLPFALVG
jgi:hypothetical protein